MDQFETMLNELCRLVIRLEGRMAEGLPAADGTIVLDTPAVGVLMGLQMFGALRPAALAAVLAMSSGGTTKRIDRLEARGLVSRRLGAVPDDRRAVLIEITDVGRGGLAAFERLVVSEAPGWVDALAPLTTAGGSAGAATSPATTLEDGAPATPPATTALFHLVGAIDQAVIEAVGDLELLHPSDPRPLLLLSELDLAGPLRVGEAATLIGRSRVSTNALLADLIAMGLLRRGPGAGGRAGRGDHRNVLATITPKGRGALRRVCDSLEAWAPMLRPLADAFVGAVDPAIDAPR
jgi:DNA-binding MarR family transcriptional regulator